MKTDAIYFDGAVKATFDDLPPEAWTHLTGAQASEEQDYYQAVPWLYRGVGLRADAVGSLPFAILEGEDEIDTSGSYENVVGFLPDPKRLFWLIEACLTCLGKSYLFHGYNLVKSVELRYLAPNSVTPKFSEKNGELLGFERKAYNRTYSLSTDDVVYFWAADPFVEYGPPKAYPLKAALNAAGVLFNVDEFASAFFERGAIKPTILSAPGLRPGSPEAKKLKSWWQRVTAGISRAFASEVAATELKAEVIGEGIRELENTELTGEKREDISTGLGVPQTLLFSNAANYATATEDNRRFYEQTVVPEATRIEAVLNEQMLKPQGLRLQFRPDTLDVFQTDEQKRSTAFLNYTNAGLPMEIAGPMLGLELPPGYEWDQIAEEKEQRRQDMQQQMGGFAPRADDESVESDIEEEAKALMLADLRRWRKKALKRGPGVSFVSDNIPDELQDRILDKLVKAESPEEIKAAFSLAMPITGPEEKQHTPVSAFLVCPTCGHGEADQYEDHGNLAVCKACGVTFDPAVMV